MVQIHSANIYSCLKKYNLLVINTLETPYLFRAIQKFKRLGCTPFTNKIETTHLMFAEDVVFLCSSSGVRLLKTSNIKHSFKKNKTLQTPEFVTELVLTAE